MVSIVDHHTDTAYLGHREILWCSFSSHGARFYFYFHASNPLWGTWILPPSAWFWGTPTSNTWAFWGVMHEMVDVPSWWVSEGPQWRPSWGRFSSSWRSRTLDSKNLFFLLSSLSFPLPAPWVTPELLLRMRTCINTCQWKMELSMWISYKINYVKCSKD